MAETDWLSPCTPVRILPAITDQMITGVVTDDRQALIRPTLRGPAGQEQEIEAIIDTGFDGCLSLPSSLIASLGLVWRQRGRALLAHGRESIFDIYEATIVWDEQARRIPVDEADTAPLVGMSLLEGYELTVQIRSSGMGPLTDDSRMLSSLREAHRAGFDPTIRTKTSRLEIFSEQLDAGCGIEQLQALRRS